MKFPIYTMISLLLFGLFMFFYIMFNYAFHNPDTGAFTFLDNNMETLLGNESVWVRDLLDFQHSWWGTGMVSCIILVIVCGFIDILRKPKDSME